MSWPFAVTASPGHWTETRLRSVLARRKQLGRPNLPLLSVNLPVGVVRRVDGDGRPAPSLDLSGYQEVRPGDVVMNQLGKPHGAIGVSKYHGITSPAYFVSEVLPAAEPRYVHHLLRTDLFISEYQRRGKNLPPNQFDISWDQFREIEISLPPLQEQRAIADYLNAETARIDALIAKKQQLIHLLEAKTLAKIFAGISGRLTSATSEQKQSGIDWLGTVPSHYGLPAIGHLFETQLGKMLNAEAAVGPDQHRYVKNTNIRWDSFDLEDLPSMSFDAADRARCDLQPGDLLVCEGGEVGRSAVWDAPDSSIYFQKALHRVRPIKSGNTRFVMYCLWAAASLNVFSVEGNHATIVHLTGEKLREHRLPYPPLDEQAEIVGTLDEHRRRVGKTSSRLADQCGLLAERRQALITAAVTGEFQVPGVA